MNNDYDHHYLIVGTKLEKGKSTTSGVPTRLPNEFLHRKRVSRCATLTCKDPCDTRQHYICRSNAFHCIHH